MAIQRAALEAVPLEGLELALLTIAIDETEFDLNYYGNVTRVHVATLQSQLFLRSGGVPHLMPMAVPPAVIESTDAECLKAAIEARLPVSLDEFRAKFGDKFVLVLNTDSGSPCLKLARHFGALSAICYMHQYCMTLTAPLHLAGLPATLFSACCLLRRRNFRSLLRHMLASHLQANLVITHTAPEPMHVEHLRSVLSLLKPLLTGRLVPEAERARQVPRTRLDALERLAVFLAGPHRDTVLRHYCPLGCHESRAAAIDELLSLIDEVVVPSFIEFM